MKSSVRPKGLARIVKLSKGRRKDRREKERQRQEERMNRTKKYPGRGCSDSETPLCGPCFVTVRVGQRLQEDCQCRLLRRTLRVSKSHAFRLSTLRSSGPYQRVSRRI